MQNRGRWAVALAGVIVLVFTDDALAWGPGMHVKLASDVLANLQFLPAAVAALIAAHRKDFIYGNVATDTVLAKKMSKVKQVCHRWSTGMGILESATTDAGKAFAYGYLAHLAADTVAHNKFLPRQMALSRCTITFGHFYWEVRADSRITRPHWTSLTELLKGSYPEAETILARHLTSTMLSYRTNRLLFKRMNLLAAEAAWRKSVDFWTRLSRHTMDEPVMRDYHEESIGRILDVLSRGAGSSVLHDDPNGNALLAYAKVQRRQLRQLKRANIPLTHAMREAAAGHAPTPNRALTIAME
ncbi:MAG TPA: zinc dependent phospholipase C family protein [Phycisphaerae bacterium]|nr:zinc dependent phospholipase C family protein [Phycisphaerae bacterium]